MATKQEERKALEKIMEIIESVGGDDSYIGKAFEECYLLAQSNIDNDYMESWKERYDIKRNEVLKKEAELHQRSEELNSVSQQAALLQCNLDDARVTIGQTKANLRELNECYTKVQAELDGKTTELEKAQREIIELKARLFDLLCK